MNIQASNVHVTGRGSRAMVFARGFGADQNMWRFVAPEFEDDFKVVLFEGHFARGRLGSGIVLNRAAAQPLRPALEQVGDELRTSSSERVFETSFGIAEPVNCDRARVGQLLSNLVGNTLAHGAPDRPVRVGAETKGGELTLCVANAGEPTSGSAMERLFEPFFRGDDRDSRQRLGLGLHIVSQIAQAHGGRIDVTSTTQETRFVFKMPLATATS